ncbi:MAG: ATP-binding protein [Deltaproteobacteria bacterium]|nr:ATP-binding protein [Deltaproteobacteria bacterium]
MALQRKTLASLTRWHAKTRRKPLVIRGARQVGKSTLVREYARQRRLRLVEVNLERHADLTESFQSLDAKRILRDLQLVASTPRFDDQTLLFIDELQAIPASLPALRYLSEERPDVAIVAAGSLLEFVLADHAFSMPVGRIEYLHLGPMSFTEFLLAVEEKELHDYLVQWTSDALKGDGPTLSLVDHTRLVSRYREYLFIGGMPEAVAEFASSADLFDVADVHRSILSTYRDDFSKYTTSSTRLPLLQRVFEFVAGSVGQKVSYAKISRDHRARSVRDVIDLLTLARVMLRVHHSDCSGLPLGATENDRIFKPLFLDVGLMNHLMGFRLEQISAMSDLRLVNEGAIAEQFVGQHLAYATHGRDEPALHYWVRQAKTANAEVDYAIAHRGRIHPIEVKAGKSGTLKSLHQFVAHKLRDDPHPLGIRFDLNPPSLMQIEASLTSGSRSVAFELLSLPLYMAEQLSSILDGLSG